MADTLYLGNRNYSSWSLRASLCLRQTRLEISEVIIPFNTISGKIRLREVSPTARVPALHHGELVIWDSLAIMAWLHEKDPDAGLMPEDDAARSISRSVIAEMHSSFYQLRSQMPMEARNIVVAGRA